MIANKLYVTSWKSKWLSNETIKSPPTSDNILTLLIDYLGNKIRIKFIESFLKQTKLQYTHGAIVNIYIVYELGASGSNDTLINCLFGAVTLTKNVDIDKYGYSGYGIGFDRRSSFSFPSGGFGQNVLIFGAEMGFSAHIDNKKKHTLVLGKGPTQGLEHTLTAETMYSINFTVTKNKFCLSLHYNEANSCLFVNGREIYKFKEKISEIVATPLCLGNISKHWSVDNMKKTGFNGYVYDLSVDYDAIAVDDILDIHKYLMKKNNIIWYDTCLSDTSRKWRIKMFGFIKKIFLTGLTVLSYLIPLCATSLNCISMTNQECKVRPKIINVNSDKPVFYPFSIKTRECSGICNNINDPYAEMCVPDVVKNLNVKVFNLMSWTNETRHIKWY